jgi:hypothetical protein
VRDAAGAICALLPASRQERLIVSHGGLTYGGFITGPDMTTAAHARHFQRGRGLPGRGRL